MKEILLKLAEYFNSFEWIDYAAMVVIILLIPVCIYVYCDSKKFDKEVEDDRKYIEKRYGRLNP